MQQDINMIVGQHIRQLREKAGKSLNIFAYESDLNPATLSRIENGLISTRLETLNKIAEGLEIPLSKLLEGL